MKPDDVPGKKWSAEEGGCEGIEHADAPRIPTLTIHRNHELSHLYYDKLPMSAFLSQEQERDRFLSRVSVMQAVIKSTRAWVKDFVVKYTLW